MRCCEARNRLTKALSEGLKRLDDPELQEHLADCRKCARHAEAIHMLDRMLEAGRIDDVADVTPLSVQRRVIDSRLAESRQSRWLMVRYRKTLTGALRIRRRYWVGFATMAAVLAIACLIPFSYDRTVGYDVAFGGVCRELGGEDRKVCNLLFDLGLDDADVDFLGCDSTCELVVIDLKSQEEVGLVVDAVSKLCNHDATADVIPVVEKGSSSLLRQANERISGPR